MLVYVLNKNGTPLMPTKRGGKVRWLLKNNLAKVKKRDPFTIQLLYDTPDEVQDIEVKMDTGYSHIGVSACSDKAELYSAEIELNNTIKSDMGNLEYDEDRVNEINDRLSTISRLKRKYRLDVDGILTLKEELIKQIDNVDNFDIFEKI